MTGAAAIGRHVLILTMWAGTTVPRVTHSPPRWVGVRGPRLSDVPLCAEG